MSSIYGIQPLKMSKYMPSKHIWNTLLTDTLAIEFMLKEEPFFFYRFPIPKTGRKIALNLNELKPNIAGIAKNIRNYYTPYGQIMN